MKPENRNKTISYIILGIVVVIGLGTYIYITLDAVHAPQTPATVSNPAAESINAERMQVAAALRSSPQFITRSDMSNVATSLERSKVTVTEQDKENVASDLQQ